MNKFKYFLAPLFITGILLVGCGKEDVGPITGTDPNPDAIVLNEPINDFVWKGMNSWYNWNHKVPNLSETKDDDEDKYHTYLNNYSEPKDLFESLLYNYPNTDRYSWFIEDYNEQSEIFRGVNDAFGFEFKLTALCEECNEVLGYITYVIPNSPASDVGIKRGEFFYKFDGTILTRDNYKIVNNYYSNNTISLSFNTIENNAITPTGKESSLTLRTVTENPVHYSDIITLESGTKVGYLVYNGFKYTFHEELNNIFSTFKAGGINELIIDFRYNGGGSVLTSAYLASMIYANASDNEAFAQLIYNSNHSDEDGAYPFFNNARVYDKEGDYTDTDVKINRLNSLTRLYVITSGNTASASEMIINGLSPFMEVVLVGTTTSGKNVGSVTLYDSRDFTKNTTVNSTHVNALQPIVFQIFNKLNQSDYTNGFEPDFKVIEYASEIKPFGDLEEPLLEKALELISGGISKVGLEKEPTIKTEPFFGSKENRKFSKEMYVLPE